MKRFYVVTVGMMGYLPESRDAFSSLHRAEQYARGLASSFREDGYEVMGSGADGFWTAGSYVIEIGSFPWSELEEMGWEKEDLG